MSIRQAVAPLVNINDMAEAYSPAGQYFAAEQVVPRLGVDSSRFAYLNFDTIHQRLIGDISRAPGGDVGEVGWDVSETTGLTSERSIQSKIHRKHVTDFGRAIAEQRAMQAVRDYLLIQAENEAVTLYQTSGNYASGYSTNLSANADKWDDFESSDPEDDVRTAVDTILLGAQITPNTIIIPYPVANKLAQHPAVRDILIRDGRGSSSEAMILDDLAGLPNPLWGMRVVVPKVSYVSSNPGQTETNAYMWGNHVTLAYLATGPSVTAPSFCYNFTSHGQSFVMGNSGVAGGGEFIEGWEDQVMAIVGTKMAYLIQNVIQ